MSSAHYDFAVVGAGVAGLTLARSLSREGSVLLVDGARDDEALRTLSFWSAGPTEVDALVRHRWRALSVRAPGHAPLELALARYEYRTLFFADLQRATKALLARNRAHAVVDGRVEGALEHRGERVEVSAAGRTFFARWAFDSRFRLAELAVDGRRYHDARQHFRGWLVRTPGPAFAGTTPRFMDFCSALEPGRAFFYVLPFAPDEALVELVTLDAVDPEPELRRYLRDALGLTHYEVRASESGVSPMTEQPFATRLGPRVRAIGVRGGRLKPSTGYALTRILDDNARVLRSLRARGHPFAAPPARPLLRAMDAVLLELWSRSPGRMPGIFHALFSRNEPDAVLRFLDERAGLGGLLRLARSLPPWPFVAAAARLARRRLAPPALALAP